MELPTRPEEVWSWIVGFLPEPWAFLIAVLLAGGTAIGAAIQAYRTFSQVLDSMSEAGRVVGSSIQGLFATVQSPEGFRASMSALLGYLGQKGVLLDDQGEFAEGVRYVVQYSSRGAARRKLIRLLKHPKAALAEWRKRASKLDPRIRFYEYMAISRLALTFDVPLAMASLEDARTIDPTAPYPVRLLGYAQMRDAKTLNKAKGTWEGLLEGAQSWQLDAVLGLASYYIERRDWRPAVDLLRQALTATSGEGPHSLKIANDLANALVGLKEFDEAERYLGEVLAVSQSVGDVRMQALAHCNLGHIFHQRGDVQQAEKHFGVAVDVLSRQPNEHFALGNALLGMAEAQAASGNHQAALASIERAESEYQSGGANRNVPIALRVRARIARMAGDEEQYHEATRAADHLEALHRI